VKRAPWPRSTKQTKQKAPLRVAISKKAEGTKKVIQATKYLPSAAAKATKGTAAAVAKAFVVLCGLIRLTRNIVTWAFYLANLRRTLKHSIRQKLPQTLLTIL
jgi:hypothetical protein